MKVLLVDDERSIRELLTVVMERDEWDVSAAASAAEALEFLGHSKFDAVVTDIRMETPQAGFDVVRKAAELVPRPAILIVTAFPLAPADWKASGADGLFIKGQEIMRLPVILRGLLSNA